MFTSLPGSPPDSTFGENTCEVSPPKSLYSSGVNALDIVKLALEFIIFSLYGWKSPTSVNGLLAQPLPNVNGTALLILTTGLSCGMLTSSVDVQPCTLRCWVGWYCHKFLNQPPVLSAHLPPVTPPSVIRFPYPEILVYFHPLSSLSSEKFRALSTSLSSSALLPNPPRNRSSITVMLNKSPRYNSCDVPLFGNLYNFPLPFVP